MLSVGNRPMPTPPALSPIDALLDRILGTMHVVTQLCSLQHHERDYALEHRTVPDYNFIYVTRGRVVWVVEDTELLLEPGWLTIVPPGVWHSGYCLEPAVTLGSLHVLATLPGGQDAFRLLGPPAHQFIPPGSRFDGYFRGFMGEFARPRSEERLQMFPGWAHLIVRELFRDNAARGLLDQGVADPLVAELLVLIGNHVDRPLTLEFLARRAGFSPQHLNRVFQRTLGTTPLKYLAQLRMDRAAGMLAEGSLTIAQVARRVGYRDPEYFARHFRRAMGATPSEWRLRAGSERPA